MATRFLPITLTCAVGVVVFLAADASAQYGQKKQPIQLPPGQIKGEVKGISSAGLMVTDGNQAYYVQPTREAKKIDVTGEAELSILKPKMFVRFDVKLDVQGKTATGKEEVKKVELFTYDPQVARTGTDKKGDDMFTIAGVLRSITKTGRAIVDIPEEKLAVTVQIAKDATLEVGVRGAPWLGLLKAGDSVTAVGRVAKPSQPKSPGVLLADEIEAKISKPAGALELGKEGTDKKAKSPEKNAPEKKAPEKKAAEKKAAGNKE